MTETPTATSAGGGRGLPLGRIHSVAGEITLVRARREHLCGLVRLLADDEIGATREGSGTEDVYLTAFEAVDADPHQVLVVGLVAEEPVTMLQISFIPGLSRRGALRAQLEGIRVAEPLRGTGVGTAMMQWAIEYCRDRGAAVVQLSTDRRRGEAHQFYFRFGFVDSHLGLKLQL
ncbi:GNAT family N-acetyltransferase [Auraticoccus monumenti]|uniref:Acetyltransferase (GNAT) family protein n=1 Tax=Auraticoccus monumenti TaxID=675864 RepID=A0A1G6V2G8_9ACTN|nr:GNAT family N-acetyltransferase [Auraticoccus monumenti]SDD47681.1 Acetyltransferase (GNAT) family protein [Auraticoccus monumenti]